VSAELNHKRTLPLFPFALEPEVKPDTSTLLPLPSYDKILVMLSGGKDSFRALFKLLDDGARPEQIELWHQAVDGRPEHLGGNAVLFDWPVTSSYVVAAGQALNLPVLFQWREGGIEREMLRENERIQACGYQLGDGRIKVSGGNRGKESTRRMFPQVSADLSVRWCSWTAKIGAADSAMCGDPRFNEGAFLIVTGERREEGGNRSKYATVERHKNTNRKRRVDHYRNVLEEREREVWDCLKYHRILPHVCYRLGFSRCSCLTCVFLSKEWATVRQIAARQFNKIAFYEQDFGKTIKHDRSVIELAERWPSFIQPGDEALIEEALSNNFPTSNFFVPCGESWQLPRGAFKHGAGPA
jgi:hypothetical protein